MVLPGANVSFLQGSKAFFLRHNVKHFVEIISTLQWHTNVVVINIFDTMHAALQCDGFLCNSGDELNGYNDRLIPYQLSCCKEIKLFNMNLKGLASKFEWVKHVWVEALKRCREPRAWSRPPRSFEEIKENFALEVLVKRNALCKFEDLYQCAMRSIQPQPTM